MALDAVKRTVSEGMSLEEADLEGIDGAIAEAGRKYESGKLMFPQFMNTVRAAYAVREELDIPIISMIQASLGSQMVKVSPSEL